MCGPSSMSFPPRGRWNLEIHCVSMGRQSPYLLALLSGALLAGAYRIPGLWMVSFVALVPLFMAVYGARSVQTAVWAGMITGVIAMGTATSWFFAILPLSSSFGVTNDLAGIVFVTFSWVLVTLVISAPLGLFVGSKPHPCTHTRCARACRPLRRV